MKIQIRKKKRSINLKNVNLKIKKKFSLKYNVE